MLLSLKKHISSYNHHFNREFCPSYKRREKSFCIQRRSNPHSKAILWNVFMVKFLLSSVNLICYLDKHQIQFRHASEFNLFFSLLRIRCSKCYFMLTRKDNEETVFLIIFRGMEMYKRRCLLQISKVKIVYVKSILFNHA